MGQLELNTHTLQLSVTERCDSHCIYCNFWQIKTPHNLSLEDIDQLLEVIDYHNIELLCVTGGEPTEHPRIVDIIKHITDITGRKILLSSNCLNYTRLEEIIDKVGNRIHTLSTSLDGNEISHDRNRGVGGAHKNVMKSLELAKKQSIETKLAITVVTGNIDDIPQLLEQYSDQILDIKTTNLSGAYYGNNTEKKGLKKQKQTIGNQLYDYLRDYYLRHDVKNLYTFYNGLYLKHGIRPICTVGLTELFIFPNADVYACYSKDKLTNFRMTTHKELDTFRKQFYTEHSSCTDCFARCSSSVVFILKNHYQTIADEIVNKWRKGESYPEQEFFQKIRNP